jgi:TolB-like protein/tetratricopeptide (TPR) repeat protein
MPALVPGYEYDVFISYRQKDNKGERWVTHFVQALKLELEATFKQDVSIYFDESPHDGLHENHEVDGSLREKIKSLVFIPILSQTYCDPNSFAWKHEFLAFRDHAVSDSLGLKVKVANGNIASRILPVRIHDLDAADAKLFEQETGMTIRSVDFAYKSSGVNRPLTSGDKREDNVNHTVYRDQINKVANAIKELIVAIGHPESLSAVGPPSPNSKEGGPTIPSDTNRSRKFIWTISALLALIVLIGLWWFVRHPKRGVVDKSIAVIPFANLSNDKDQEYFSDGMTEDILSHLSKIADLQVKSRTSTLKYKGTTKSIAEIGAELGVGTILEGSVRKADGKVRIVVQLVEVGKDIDLWSETYDRDMSDVLNLQRDIAVEIARQLEARLTEQEDKIISHPASTDVTAYDYYLKAKQIHNEFDANNQSDELRKMNLNSLELINKAIHLDPAFSDAYALKSQIWFNLYGLPAQRNMDSAYFFASKAVALNPSSPSGNLAEGKILGYKKASKSAIAFEHALDLDPNNPDALKTLGGYYLDAGNPKGAEMILKAIDLQFAKRDPSYWLEYGNIFLFGMQDYASAEKFYQKALSISPNSIEAHFRLAFLHCWFTRNFDQAITECNILQRVLGPDYFFVNERLGWVYFLQGKWEKAEISWSKYRQAEKNLMDSTQYFPVRHRVAQVKWILGDKPGAMNLFQEQMRLDLEVVTGKRGGGLWDPWAEFYDLAAVNSFLGHPEEAFRWLDSAKTRNFNWHWGVYNDPLLDPIRGDKRFKDLIERFRNNDRISAEAFRAAGKRYNMDLLLKEAGEK